MRAVALVKSRQHVCYRYRLAAFEPALVAEGWDLSVRAIAGLAPGRLAQFVRLVPARVVYLQRMLLKRWELRWLRSCARSLIYDFDDAVLYRHSYDTKGLFSRARARRFREVVEAADVVIAGNEFLSEQAAKIADPAKVRLIPTCVEPRRYPAANHQRRLPGVELVWIGSVSNLESVRQLRPALEHAGQRLRGLKLRVICARFPKFGAVELVRCPWSTQTEAADLAAADIGVSWLADDLWSRGKCGLKVVQYMAAGLPVVANSIGVHRELVRHGVTGFLADTPQEWLEAIGQLAGDPQLRREMGLRGRELVVERYSVDRWAPVVAETFRQAADLTQPTAAAPRVAASHALRVSLPQPRPALHQS